MTTHKCSAIGCELQVPVSLLMCKRHWAMVPDGLQAAVWRNYREGQERTGGATKAYYAAARAAVDAVSQPPAVKPDLRTCPAIGCKETIPEHVFMCARHLKLCPDALQRRVYRANSARCEGRGTEQACDEAVREAVMETQRWEELAAQNQRQGNLI